MRVEVDKITDEMITAASQDEDLDRAVRVLQIAAGITDGGIAGHHFDEDEWPAATHAEREALIRGWLDEERITQEIDDSENDAAKGDAS